MSITTTLAAVAVTDLQEARDFYTRLFGRPADQEPMPGLAQWDSGLAGGLQVVEDVGRSGSSLVTLLVEDLDVVVTELAQRGVHTGGTLDGAISRITQTTDPAGNTITLAELHDQV